MEAQTFIGHTQDLAVFKDSATTSTPYSSPTPHVRRGASPPLVKAPQLIRDSRAADQPKKVYFTGLRITTNQSQPVWETLKWEACCQKFTFPDGVATTLPASAATGTASANGLLTGLDGSTFSFIM